MRDRKRLLCQTHLEIKESLPTRDCSSDFVADFLVDHETRRVSISVKHVGVTESVICTVSNCTPKQV